MQPDLEIGERLPSSGSFLDEGCECASAAPSGNPERDKRNCETDMRLGVETNILPRVRSIPFYPPPLPLPPARRANPERRFVTKLPISALKRPALT